MEIFLFVSYETSTGFAYAKLAKARFVAAGYKAWVWHDDRTTGEYLHEEIADQIDGCAYVVYINTDGSHDSGGQKFERNTALALQKMPHVISLSGSTLSPVLASCNRVPTDVAGFETACDGLAEELRQRAQLGVQPTRTVAESTLLTSSKPPATGSFQ